MTLAGTTIPDESAAESNSTEWVPYTLQISKTETLQSNTVCCHF